MTPGPTQTDVFAGSRAVGCFQPPSFGLDIAYTLLRAIMVTFGFAQQRHQQERAATQQAGQQQAKYDVARDIDNQPADQADADTRREIEELAVRG